ncbi:MAG: DMP19 family protein [Chloroflexi bacterium]|nr:DMP19 family protein [Chloroflexota bacterium]
MEWFRKLFNKPAKSGSLFPGKRLPIEQIFALKNSTEMIIEFSYGISDKIHKKGFESLSHPERVLHHIYWLESEVNNGGFQQYFDNSSGDYAIDTPSALEEIGAKHTANLMKRANDLFPNGAPSRDRQQRLEQLDSFDETNRNKFEDLDSEFFKYQDPLEELQVKYMVVNKDQIEV